MVLGDEANHRNSMKLDLAEPANGAAEGPKETYKPIPEYPLVEAHLENGKIYLKPLVFPQEFLSGEWSRNSISNSIGFAKFSEE